MKIRLTVIIIVTLFLLLNISLPVNGFIISKIENEVNSKPKITYRVKTVDHSTIMLTRYIGSKQPIIFIHGMGCNHRIYDMDDDHSLAQYLNFFDWDVWLLDLRTHDGDGDFKFSILSDREYIDRNWDFDNTLLKIDVVTAVDFVKNITKENQVILSGHSYGGYLAYAYAMVIGEENLSGIITTGSSPYANPEGFHQLYINKMDDYGYYSGKYAFVKPDGNNAYYPPSKLQCIYYYLIWNTFDHSALFYKQQTSNKIQKRCLFLSDAEPAGVFVDLYFGKNPYKYNGYWVDPQTLFNYSMNLKKINVPILFIAGDEDLQDPKEDIFKAFENVSSKDKTFLSFSNHAHMDLLLGQNASKIIFPRINQWLEERKT